MSRRRNTRDATYGEAATKAETESSPRKPSAAKPQPKVEKQDSPQRHRVRRVQRNS